MTDTRHDYFGGLTESEYYAKVNVLFDQALSIGYTREDAGRCAEEAYFIASFPGRYGDECATHPGMRIYYGETECEACIVVRQATGQ